MDCLRASASVVLSIQTSAAQIERDFSILGSIMVPQRSTLSPRLLDGIAVCRLNRDDMPQNEFEVKTLRKPSGERNLRSFLPVQLDKQQLTQLQGGPQPKPPVPTQQIINKRVDGMPSAEARMFFAALWCRLLSNLSPELENLIHTEMEKATASNANALGVVSPESVAGAEKPAATEGPRAAEKPGPRTRGKKRQRR